MQEKLLLWRQQEPLTLLLPFPRLPSPLLAQLPPLLPFLKLLRRLLLPAVALRTTARTALSQRQCRQGR